MFIWNVILGSHTYLNALRASPPSVVRKNDSQVNAHKRHSLLENYIIFQNVIQKYFHLNFNPNRTKSISTKPESKFIKKKNIQKNTLHYKYQNLPVESTKSTEHVSTKSTKNT